MDETTGMAWYWEPFKNTTHHIETNRVFLEYWENSGPLIEWLDATRTETQIDGWQTSINRETEPIIRYILIHCHIRQRH